MKSCRILINFTLIICFVIILTSAVYAIPFENLSNNHFYEFVQDPLQWQQAKDAAENRNHLGLQVISPQLFRKASNLSSNKCLTDIQSLIAARYGSGVVTPRKRENGNG
jgi:hypothetical protein